MSSNPLNFLNWGNNIVPQPTPAPAPPATPEQEALTQVLLGLHANLQLLHSKVTQLVQKAAYLDMPEDGTPFNEVTYADLPAIGAQAVIIQFTVPQGSNGVIKWIGNNYVGAGWTEGTGDLVYQLLADGQPIRNFERIIGSLGSPASPSETAPVRIYESQVIQLVCTNVSITVAQQLLGGRLSGWYYPVWYDQEQGEVDDGE
jgi:hypothetical protein